MPSNRRTSNEYFEPGPSRRMGSLEAKNALKKQQYSEIVKEPVRLPQGYRQNLQNPVSQRTAKSSGDCLGHRVARTTTKNDELVKHMSNLPGYLQRAEKQENIQEKALNVGVLDWERLQKWKNKQNGRPSSGGSSMSSKSSSVSRNTIAKSFSLANTVPGDTQANKTKQLEFRKKELQHSETDGKNNGSLSRKTSAKSFAHPSTVPEDTLSGKSKQLEVRKKELQNSNIDYPNYLPGDLKNIVLLIPKRSAQYSTLGGPPELLGKNWTKAKSPDDFTQKSEKPPSESPHSCPLPSRVECDSETGMQHLSFNSENKGHMLSLSKCEEKTKVELEDARDENLKTLDQEMAGLANRRKSRNQSPHRRFSFSFSRMSRSFSFKEGPVVQQLSSSYVSVKSGPVKSEASGCLDDSSSEKGKAQNRVRSTQLRRMLDPLLKPKSLNSIGFTDILRPLEGSLNSSDSKSTASESFEKEKHVSSTIQALIQLTLKDGLPLFRFVVNNSSNILAATRKISTSSGDVDMGQSYTFYSVNEIKKRTGSWISQGSKERSCGFAYDIVGEMKISGSHISDVKDSNSQSLIRESVLLGVDCRQANQAAQKLTHNIELAAIVVEMPREDFIHGVQQSYKDTTNWSFTESLQKEGFSFNIPENEGSNSMTVILPGGIHSLPDNGSPSSLIHRWRSSGSCDCGGWDVGCKLRILSNQNGSSKNQMTCQAFVDQDCVELFVQGETIQSRPIFSLAPHKHGLFTIEFDSSISALQAFFVSVTVICCKKSSSLLEVNNLSSEKVFQESMLKGSDGMENKSTILLGKIPAKFAPIPPLSPFGRV